MLQKLLKGSCLKQVLLKTVFMQTLPWELKFLTELQMKLPISLNSSQISAGLGRVTPVTLLLHQHGISPPRSPIWAVTKYNLCFNCVMLWDHCLTGGLWIEKKGWMWWGLSSYSHLSLLSQSVREHLVFTNCKFHGFGFCFARNSTKATDKVQHRHADYQLFPQIAEEMSTAQKT